MRKIYFISSVFLFLLATIATVVLYISTNNQNSYFGNDWMGDLWLSPHNKNVAEIRLTNTENLVISNMVNKNTFYEIEFFRGSEKLKANFIIGKSYIYNIDYGSGGVMIGSITDLLKPQGGSVSVKYHKSLSSTDLIIDQIFL